VLADGCLRHQIAVILENRDLRVREAVEVSSNLGDDIDHEVCAVALDA
jgi:hypothetical protein